MLSWFSQTDTTTNNWLAKWDGFLSAMKLGSSRASEVGSTQFVFSIMLRLYAHKPVVSELHALYDYSPDLFLFYVPQLVNFALHGGVDQLALISLENFLKDKCSTSLRFALRVHWFVLAFSPTDIEGVIFTNAETGGQKTCSELPLLEAPRTMPSTADKLDLSKPLSRLAKGPPHVIGISAFKWTLAFCEELANMGTLLKEVPLAERVTKLRATLRQLEEDFMPSRFLYLPLGKVSTRIVGIIAKESFCFKTNERVPFLICLELIDDPPKSDLPTSNMLQRSPSLSNDNVGDDTKVLGQWTPKSNTLGGKGAGFSHLGMHPDFQFEHERENAKKLVLAQFKSGDFVEVQLHEAQVPGTMHTLVARNSTDGADMYDIGLSLEKEVTEDDHEYDEEFLPEDENKVIFSERWAAKEQRIAALSRWSHHPRWRLMPVIVKSGDDLRQEQFASQLIALFDMIFKEEGLDLWLHSYDVLAVSPDSGIIECVPDTISLDSLKKNDPSYTNLKNFFIRYFGRTNSEGFIKARENFAKSLAAYCIVCYILQIKDRHNGNLLLDAEGHIVHIDFGFILGSLGPGRMNFEGDVPFKLTSEFIQVLGGPESSTFRSFRTMCCKGYLAARKRREQFVLMIEMMSNKSTLPCFQSGPEATIRALDQRFSLEKSRAGCISFVNDLIDTSINHWRQRYYDVYQSCCVGIAV